MRQPPARAFLRWKFLVGPLPRTPAGRTPGLDAWLDGRGLEDATLAAYLAELHDVGRAPASASTAVAGACFRARLAGEPSPAGERTARVLALRWADVADAADGDGVLVTVRRSKTNRRARRRTSGS